MTPTVIGRWQTRVVLLATVGLLLAGIVEAALIYVLATTVSLPGLPRDLSLGLFVFHYTVVWLAVFFFAQGPMRALFPWWRFHGGRIWPGVGASQRRET
jgi:hypothetical protein